MKRKMLKLVPLLDVEKFNDLKMFHNQEMTLGEFLNRAPALSTEPIDEDLMNRKLDDFIITPVQEPHTCPLYRPPGMLAKPHQGTEEASGKKPGKDGKTGDVTGKKTVSAAPGDGKGAAEALPPIQDAPLPTGDIKEKDAVRLAYAREIESAASFLRTELSVLIVCDKLVVQHLWEEIAGKAHLEPVELTVPVEDEGGLMPRGLRQRQLARLKEIIRDLKEGQVLVIPHLDLLAGGSDSNIPTESRELIELVYQNSDRLVLAFADRSMEVPEVLAARFAVRLLISGVSRMAVYPNGDEVPIGKALVTAKEAAHFNEFDPEGLYKNVAGMNPIQLRHAIKYAVKEYAGTGKVPVRDLYKAIRAFKVQTSTNFEVPDVSFQDIGGYDDVKAELGRAINLMTGSYKLPNDQLRRELIPRGFIFYGPPGTGKTLFAKAIANMLNATIQVVSGPEVTDMYVGESERKVRELFAEARRNAPSVLVFDEFDSIAAKRSGRDDGGSRAGNALVAQILTEMDGFRPDVPMLVIGTTNRPDMIDEALLRPSRFKAIAVNLPDQAARRAIARVHARHFQIDVSPELLEVIATASEGLNGDDIRSLFRDACVGKYCLDPPAPADAQRFGKLVGALRRDAEQRAASTAAHRSAARHITRRDDRPAPTGAMISLVGGEQNDEV